jgi:hypothetical protein
MKSFRILSILLFPFAAFATAAEPRAGEPADIAPFGSVVAWNDAAPRDLASRPAERRDGAFVPAAGSEDLGGRYLGLEWDAPRIVEKIAMRLRAGGAPASGTEKMAVLYWHKSWDGRATATSGWAQIDDPLTGKWKRAGGEWRADGSTLTFAFSPKLSAELKNAPDGVTFRKTYKVRVAFGGEAPLVESLAALSPGKWAPCDLEVTGPAAAKASAEVLNGHRADGAAPLEFGPGRPAPLRLLRLDLSALGGKAGPRDERTVVTLDTPKGKVSFAADDALAAPLAIPDFGIEVRPAGGPAFTPAATKRVLAAIRDEPEQTWSRARSETIAPQKTLQRGEVRYSPLSWDGHRHKFMVFHDGSVAMDCRAGKLWETSPEKLGWPAPRVRYGFLAGEDRWAHEGEHENRQELEEGYLPVVRTVWDHDGVRYDETAFATLVGPKPAYDAMKGDEPAALVLRFRLTNLLTDRRTARLWMVPSAAEDLKLLRKDREGVGGSGILMADGSKVRALLRWRAGSSEIAAAGEGDKATKALLYAVELPPLHTEILDVTIPFAAPDPDLFDRIDSLDPDRERREVLAYWRDLLDAQGSAVRVPDTTIGDFIRANRAHIGISVQRDLGTGFDMVPAATFNYQVCMNEACYQILACDVQGLHDRAARYLEPFLRLQGTDPLDGGFRSKDGVFHGLPVEGHNYQGFRYNLDHGFVLWTLGEHYLLSRDRAWMDRNADRLAAGCAFIERERKAAAAAPGGDRDAVRGLVPPGHLEDVAEWHRWFAVNSYFHLGMKRAGQALAAHGDGRGVKFLAEAEAYRKDIARAAAAARERSPVVRVRDGTAIPHTPSRADLRGREVGWIREQLYGSIHLVLGEVLDPPSPEAGWIVDDFEDNVFPSPEYGRQADLPAFWFSHGGHAVQSNLVPCVRLHLLRGDHRAAVRTLLNNLATNLFEDVRQSTEHPVEHFGHGRGPFYKSSDEGSWVVSMRNALAFEKDPETLWLLPAAPREWFGPGQTIAARDLATWFGPCSVVVEGGERSIRAIASLPSRQAPRRTVIFLRDAGGRPIREARALDAGGASKPLPILDAAEGGIDLSGLAGDVKVEARY